MIYQSVYTSPLGDITLACNESALIGLWFNDQKHFGSALPKEVAPDNMPTSKNKETSAASGEAAAVPARTATSSDEEALPSKTNKTTAAPSEISTTPGETIHPILKEARQWLDIYFSGRNPGFCVPLRYGTTAFRKKVCDIMRSIPYGKTMTYGEIANILAHDTPAGKMSAQAVGGAVGHNPISIIIPCHRVVGAGKKLTGYAGGIERKIKLLELEGINTSEFFMP